MAARRSSKLLLASETPPLYPDPPPQSFAEPTAKPPEHSRAPPTAALPRNMTFFVVSPFTAVTSPSLLSAATAARRLPDRPYNEAMKDVRAGVLFVNEIGRDLDENPTGPRKFVSDLL